MNIPVYLKNRPYLTIILVVFLMLSFSISSIDITIMEARNFITAREIINDGNWLLTTINGEPRYQKPPLPTWITALFMFVFGIKKLLFLRLPAIIMVALVGIIAFKMSNTILNDNEKSLVNALLTITSFYVMAIIIEAPWDIYAHGFMYIAILLLFKLLQQNQIKYNLVIFSGLSLGASFLSKGPISFYALLLPFLLAYSVSYKFRQLKHKLLPFLIALIIGLLVGSLWYVYIWITDSESFLKITITEASNWRSYQVKPIYYYWSFFIQSGLWTIPAFVSLMYPFLRLKVTDRKAYKFTFLWTIFSVVLLSIIPEKKSRYLMPVLIPLALNMGIYINYAITSIKSFKRLAYLPLYFHFSLIALLCFVIPVGSFYVLLEQDNVNWILLSVLTLILVLIGICLIKAIIGKNVLHQFYLTIIFYTSLFALALPFHKHFKNPNFRSVSLLNAEIKKIDVPLFSYNRVSPETIWAYGEKIKPLPTDISQLSDKTIALIATSENNPNTNSKLLKQYNLKLISTYDLNFSKSNSKGYKNRLLNNYYLLTKK